MIKNVSLLTFTFIGFLSLSLADVSDWTLEDIEIRGYRNRAFLEENALSPIKNLLKIENDLFRRALYGELWGKIHDSNQLEDARELTELFVEGVDDLPHYVLGRLILPPFEKEYFTDEAVQRILSNDLANGYQSMYIRALGVIENTDPRVDVKDLATKSDVFSSERKKALFEGLGVKDKIKYDSAHWAALLVEARQDNQEALEVILNDLKEKDESYIMDHTQVVEDLGFVRQAAAVDLLVQYLFSEKGSPSQPIQGGTDYGITPLASRAVKALTLALVDFPHDYWDENVFWDDVEEARAYIKNYKGEWRIIGKWEPQRSVAETPSVSSEPAVAETSEAIKPPEPAIEEPVELTIAEPPEPSAEQSSNWWLWLIGLLVVVGGLTVVVRRKS